MHYEDIKIEAQQVKKGDQIELDMGYGAHAFDCYCTVLEATARAGLFGDAAVQFVVRYGAHTINTCDFTPTNKMSVRRLVKGKAKAKAL